jgi:NADH:ubiquinone oxidoreductase subunit 5 (subunit L)/multisubunit Na+/H+ antiporter MnhA subunit
MNSGMSPVAIIAFALTLMAPLVSVAVAGLMVLLNNRSPSESRVARIVGAGLALSTMGSLAVLAGYLGMPGMTIGGEHELGDWLRIGDFVIPAVLFVDTISVTISLFAAFLTALVARFSRTYLHKEPGFNRFYILLGLFATGTQLVALAGGLELFFAGWELIGISSAFFIGFFHERDEPVRSSIRAFATYRLSDAGLLLATVLTFEFLGSARFSAFSGVAALPAATSTLIALLFLLSAMGKSAQLPFSGWLPRAMEGPTPSSALFYGAVSIHAGLFLLLRVWPVMEVSMIARGIGVAVGLLTAIYAASVVRVHTDAKGALAHATLSQVGLILAEICMGWTTFALVHLVCHAFLRIGQYLKAPNMIHDSHRLGHSHRGPTRLERIAPVLAARIYASSLHRLRLDDRIDDVFAPILSLARLLDRADRRLRATLSLDRTSR